MGKRREGVFLLPESLLPVESESHDSLGVSVILITLEK